MQNTTITNNADALGPRQIAKLVIDATNLVQRSDTALRQLGTAEIQTALEPRYAQLLATIDLQSTSDQLASTVAAFQRNHTQTVAEIQRMEAEQSKTLAKYKSDWDARVAASENNAKTELTELAQKLAARKKLAAEEMAQLRQARDSEINTMRAETEAKIAQRKAEDLQGATEFVGAYDNCRATFVEVKSLFEANCNDKSKLPLVAQVFPTQTRAKKREVVASATTAPVVLGTMETASAPVAADVAAPVAVENSGVVVAVGG